LRRKLSYHDLPLKSTPLQLVFMKKLYLEQRRGIHEVITNIKSDKEKIRDNQKLKSYDKNTILQILDYQKKHHLNNTELALHFKLSRNTVAKWKKIFCSAHPQLDEPYY